MKEDHYVDAQIFLKQVQKLADEYTKKTGATIQFVNFNLGTVSNGLGEIGEFKYGVPTMQSLGVGKNWVNTFENGILAVQKRN